MKYTGNVTTVMAIVAQGISECGFWYPLAFFYALSVGRKYGVGLNNFEFVERLYNFLEIWSEKKNGQTNKKDF